MPLHTNPPSVSNVWPPFLSGNKEKPMTRDNGTWSYRWNGVTISAPTLEKLIKAVAELGLLEGGEE